MTKYLCTGSFECRLRALRCVALSLLLAFSEACNHSTESSNEIRIGLITPLHHSLASSIGNPGLDGAKLAVQKINDYGGLRIGSVREPVVLVVEDSQGHPEASMDAARKLINQDKVVALVGPFLSRTAVAAAAVAEQTHTPMISPTATAAQLTEGRRFVFRTTFVDALQGQAIARFAREELGARRAAVLFDAAGLHNRKVAEFFNRTFTAAGGELVAFEHYTTGETDLSTQLLRIHEAAPEVLLLPNHVDEVPNQARQARQLGISATFLGSDAWDGDSFRKEAILAGSFFTDDWQMGITNLESEESQEFDRLYRETFGNDPPSVAAAAYDSFGVLFAAIELCNTLESSTVRHSLAHLQNYRGVTGSFSFRGNGDAQKSIFIFGIEDGQVFFSKRIPPKV